MENVWDCYVIHTQESLVRDLQNLGIQPADRVLVHASLKAIGLVENGMDTVLDALQASLSDGLLLLPSHTWMDWNNPEGIFDPAMEPSCVGALSEHFRKRPGVVRSWHPTHSICGFGKEAANYLAGEEHTRTPCPRAGCWGRLYDIEAKILFLGAPTRTNTFLHSVEEWLDIPDRLATEQTLYRIRRPDASLLSCPQYRHFSSLGDVSQYFGKIEPEMLRLGIAREGKIGDARCVLMEAKPLADWVVEILNRDPRFFEYI